MEVKLNARRTATVLTVDNFLTNPDAVRQFALDQEFVSAPAYFRGCRTRSKFVWPGLRERFQQLLGKYIASDWADHSSNGVFQFCVGGDQIVYHADANTHAAILYLTPDAPPEAGTTLYRSRSLKGRSVPEVMTIKSYPQDTVSQITQEFYKDKLLDPTAWDVVDVIGNVYNRLVIWDAKMVHSASCYFGSSKETGRLFQMFFFNAE
jgi:hypothetical protein